MSLVLLRYVFKLGHLAYHLQKLVVGFVFNAPGLLVVAGVGFKLLIDQLVGVHDMQVLELVEHSIFVIQWLLIPVLGVVQGVLGFQFKKVGEVLEAVGEWADRVEAPVDQN